MSICDGPMYTCDNTRSAVIEWTQTLDVSQTRNRQFSLVVGAETISLNKRVRDFQYSDSEKTERSSFKYVVSESQQNATFECFSQEVTPLASIEESYQTIDSTILFADLRNDLVVYEESVQTMTFSDERDFRIAARTTWGDTYLYPFMLEDVPILISKKIKCTKIGYDLHDESINSGYWNGIRILMPLFGSGSSPYGTFELDGVTYDAAEVDWYYIPNHKASDGDEFFFWADWHKAVGVHNEIDELEAATMWYVMTGMTPAPYTTTSNNGLFTKDFMGSAAKDVAGNLFLSAALDVTAGKVKVNKLIILGTETTIPTDCECDVWFPIAPL